MKPTCDPHVRQVVLEELKGSSSLTRDELCALVYERTHLQRGWSESTVSRRVREAVNSLEADGFPIVSDGEGFHMTEDRAELEGWARRLERQGIALLARAARVRRVPLSRRLQQLALDFGGAA